MLDSYTQALNSLEEKQAQAEKSYANFAGSAGHQEMIQHKFETLLANPDTLWEAIGPDAIKYPFDTNMLCKSEIERAEIRRRVNDFDNRLACQLAALVIAKDDAEFGRIMREMCEQYLKPQIDEWVEDNWRAWA